jgi:hypothetical protein
MSFVLRTASAGRAGGAEMVKEIAREGSADGVRGRAIGIRRASFMREYSTYNTSRSIGIYRAFEKDG